MTVALVSLPWAALCGGLLYALTRVLDRSHAERQQLLQRIQAPEVAVAQHVHATEAAPEGLGYVPLEDDEALVANFREMIDGA